MNEKRITVLFLCSANSGRSVMAEAMLNQLGKGRFAAYSAGTYPTGRVNPLALDVLRSRGYPDQGLGSKSWLQFASLEQLPLDFVITLCKFAAREVQPRWGGAPIKLHWDICSPDATQGSDAEIRQAFDDACGAIELAMQDTWLLD